MMLASDAPAIAALVTASVAVVGLAVTAVFNQLSRRDSDRERKSLALHDASKRLSSPSAPKRALAMAAVVEHLNHSATSASARRIALNALHYETEPLVVELAVDQIKDSGQQREATAELVHLNRHLWQGMLDLFARVLAGGQGDRQSIAAELEKLSYNQAIVSRLIQDQTVSDIDFTDTFYPELWAPTVRFTKCNFTSALLHYSNLRAAHFEDCILDRTILIGAYLEDTTFLRSPTDDAVSFGAASVDARNRNRSRPLMSCSMPVRASPLRSSTSSNRIGTAIGPPEPTNADSRPSGGTSRARSKRRSSRARTRSTEHNRATETTACTRSIASRRSIGNGTSC